MKIRNFEMVDYPQVVALWQQVGEFHEELDNPTIIEQKLKNTPDLFLVAEENEKIVGTVMGSFDGRIGYVGRLVIHPSYRRRGTASSLMDELEKRLKQRGCPVIGLIVVRTNKAAIELYKKRGYTLLSEVTYMRKRL